jgi:hypothetical protein
MKKLKYFFYLSTLIVVFGCEKFNEISPPNNQLTNVEVYATDQTALAVVTNNYIQMVQSGFASGTANSVTVASGLSADELMSHSTIIGNQELYLNSLTPSNTVVGNGINGIWGSAYKTIYIANSAIENIENNEKISKSVADQLIGESKFIRAFCHFYLTELWGDIPMILTTDYRVTSVASRVPKTKIYDQIVADLKDAKLLLTDQYLSGNNTNTTERIRPNKYAAIALLARVYLYQKDYVNAEKESSTIIAKEDTYRISPNLNDVFLKNSIEAIWQLQPVLPGLNTNEGNLFNLIARPTTVSLTPNLVTSFNDQDKRRINWIKEVTFNGIKYYHSYKYKIKTGAVLSEYSMVMRLSEQYLIRAEARIHLQNLTGAISDVDKILERAGLGLISITNASITNDALENVINDQYKKEFFNEWAHRWLNLKRSGKVDQVLAEIKGSNWNTNDQLYPIPKAELERNPFLAPQNIGY